MTLNGVMAVTLRYFIEFGKPALQKTICGGIYARVYCIFSACTMSSQRKFTFAISSPDEFLVLHSGKNSSTAGQKTAYVRHVHKGSSGINVVSDWECKLNGIRPQGKPRYNWIDHNKNGLMID